MASFPGWPHPSRLRALPDSQRGIPADLTGERGLRAAIRAVRAGVSENSALVAVNNWRHAYYTTTRYEALPVWGVDWRHEADRRALLDAGRDLLGALTASAVLPLHLYETVAAGTLGRDRPSSEHGDVCRVAWDVARLIKERAGNYLTDLFLTLDARYAGGWDRWGYAGRPCGVCGGSERDRGHQEWCKRQHLIAEYVLTVETEDGRRAA